MTNWLRFKLLAAELLALEDKAIVCRARELAH